MKAKKSLGQNFLEDQNILRKEAKLLNPKHKTVLEIGAGDGRLSEKILEHEPERLFMVEKDSELAGILHDKFCGCSARPIMRGEQLGNLFPECGEQTIVLEGDVLELDLPKVDLIAGNIPYYITSQIIFRIAKEKFKRAVLIVQKEFAQKMAAKPGEKNYGRLSVTAQIAFSVKLIQIVPRHLFKPMPKVDSAMILLRPTGKRLTQFEENIIRWLFSHKNKNVRNALLDSKMFDKGELETLGKYAKRKVRTLVKEEVLEIAKLLS
jgi:ribosomal RNA small subunit methyltransferase A